MPASISDATSNPHGVSDGAAAASLAHVPSCPGRLQRISGSVQAVSQHTTSTQKPDAQAGPVVQEPPLGIGVRVGVAVGVRVGVVVGVGVGTQPPIPSETQQVPATHVSRPLQHSWDEVQPLAPLATQHLPPLHVACALQHSALLVQPGLEVWLF